MATATIIGTWLRGSLALSSGLWRDEVQSLAISRLPTLADVLSFLAREESHPPLFYLLERAWVAVAGDSDRSLVMLGLIPGIATIPFGAFVAWRLGGSFAGVLAALYAAVAWPLIWQSGDARPYALLALLALAATSAAFDAAARGARASWTIYALCSLGLIYTHNWSLLIVAGLAVLTLITLAKRPGTRAEALRRWAWTHAAIALLYVPWIPVLLGQAQSAGYGRLTRLPVEWPLFASILGLDVTLLLLLPGVAVLVLGSWKARRVEATSGDTAFLVWAAVLPSAFAAALWRVSDLTLTHCATILTPCILVAVAVSLGGDGPPATRKRRAVAGLAFLVILGAATASRWYRKSNLREAATTMSVNSTPRDLLVVHPASLAPSVLRYGRKGMEVVTFPPQRPVAPVRFGGWWARFDDMAALAQVVAAVDRARREGRTIWLLREVRSDAAPDSTAPSGTRERFWYSVGASLAEIRSTLAEQYGLPDQMFTMPGGRWRRERVTLERYALPGGAE